MAFQVLALIAARSGSRGLKNKNIRRVAGGPLLVHAIDLARSCRRSGEAWRIVVSTDSKGYAAIARSAGAEVPFLRPAVLATDRARLIDVVRHALETLQNRGARFDAVVLLSATTPLTTRADVRRGITLFQRSRLAVVSVTPDRVPDAWRFAIERGRVITVGQSSRVGRRQEAPKRYHLNGAVYIAAPEWIEHHGQFFVSGRTLPLLMPRERSLDIEDRFDLAIAEFLRSRNTKEIRQRV